MDKIRPAYIVGEGGEILPLPEMTDRDRLAEKLYINAINSLDDVTNDYIEAENAIALADTFFRILKDDTDE